MNKFLIRTPIFPIKYLDEFYNSPDSVTFINSFFENNKVFKESIYYYSKSLYHQAVNLNNLDLKKSNKVSESLIKYFFRMCFRATPFGLSAGLAVGEFSKENNNKKIHYSQRSIKIDSGVFSNILTEINKLKTVRENVIFFINNTLYKNKEKIRLIEKHYLNNAFDFSLVKIDTTEILEDIQQLGKLGFQLHILRDFIHTQYKDITEQELNGFINGLIDSQFIISELQYSVLQLDYKEIVNKLYLFNEKTNDSKLLKKIGLLEKILELTGKLEKLSLEEKGAISIIQKIDQILSPYNVSDKSSLQIDLIGDSNFNLNERVKSDIEKKIPFFFKIHSELNINDELTEFKKKFTNKYGNGIIPFLEVLDPEVGVGFPVLKPSDFNSFLLDEIDIKPKSIPNKQLRHWDRFLINKYEEYLKGRHSIMKLTKNDLIFLKDRKYEFNDSILFSGQIYECGNTYKYFLNSLKIGVAHFTSGRFAYNSTQIKKYGEEITDFEKEKLNENQIYAEISHLSQPRLGNVSQRKNYYKYYIPVWDVANDSSSYNIALNDLFIFIRNEKLVLYSKKLDKQIIPRLGCAQNTNLLTNSIYRFLGALGDDYFINFWDWGILKEKNHLPRVEFENFILSKEQWILDKNKIYNSSSDDLSVLTKYLKDLDINKSITMSLGGDNILPIDLNNEKSLLLLKKTLLINKTVILEESLPFTEDIIEVSNNYGQVTSEVHIPFLLSEEKKDRINIQEIEQVIKNSTNRTKVKLFPGEKSLYFKMYVNNENIDKTFINKLLLLTLELKNEGHIEKFFFIRYFDPEYHFRLRFFSSKINSNIILNKFNNIFLGEIEDLIINKIEISTYEKETERYGGIEGLQISENIFHYDSFCILKVLSWILEHNKQTEKWLIAMVGVHYWFNDFKVDNLDRVKILEELKNYYSQFISNNKEVYKNISTFFRIHRSEINIKMQTDFFEQNYFSFFQHRSSHSISFIQDLENNNIDYDVKNYIHMSLNRFFEKKQNYQELIIYDLLVLYYKSIKYLK